MSGKDISDVPNMGILYPFTIKTIVYLGEDIWPLNLPCPNSQICYDQ